MGLLPAPDLAAQPSAAFLAASRWVLDVAERGQLTTDQGGLTRWGISQNAYPDEDIVEMTRARAEAIYLRDFWLPIKGDSFPPIIAFVLFDAAINSGPVQAIKLLQRALRVEEDGIVGPVTIRAAGIYPHVESVARFLERRLTFYRELVISNPARHGTSLYGWNLRVLRLALEAGTWRST